jgi:hypothetical protein
MSRVRSVASMAFGSLGIALVTLAAGAVCSLESALAQTGLSGCNTGECNYTCGFTPLLNTCSKKQGNCRSNSSRCKQCGCKKLANSCFCL